MSDGVCVLLTFVKKLSFNFYSKVASCQKLKEVRGIAKHSISWKVIMLVSEAIHSEKSLWNTQRGGKQVSKINSLLKSPCWIEPADINGHPHKVISIRKLNVNSSEVSWLPIIWALVTFSPSQRLTAFYVVKSNTHRWKHLPLHDSSKEELNIFPDTQRNTPYPNRTAQPSAVAATQRHARPNRTNQRSKLFWNSSTGTFHQN